MRVPAHRGDARLLGEVAAPPHDEKPSFVVTETDSFAPARRSALVARPHSSSKTEDERTFL